MNEPSAYIESRALQSQKVNAALKRVDGFAEEVGAVLETLSQFGRSLSVSLSILRPRKVRALRHRCAGAGEYEVRAVATVGAFSFEPRPNPSLERTRTGMALGPRGVVVHHPPRGPSTTPPLAAQLKR